MATETQIQKVNKFERARILGARSLQLAVGAPPMIKTGKMFKPFEVAMQEFKEGLVPIVIIQD